MLLGSTSKNVNILSVLSIVIAVGGLFTTAVFNLENILLCIFSFYVFNIIGVWLVLHRYYSHRSFEFRSKIIELIFSGVALLSGRGSILSWVYIHRLHHKYSDGVEDPHPPIKLGYKIFGFGHYRSMEQSEMKIFMVKELLTRWHLWVHKYYVLLIIGFALALGLYNVQLLYFGYIVPLTLVHLSQNNFNYFGHKFGYRNHATGDQSRNVPVLFPFILGEAWHNNHHHNPRSWNTKVKWWEFDPLALVIRVVGKKAV